MSVNRYQPHLFVLPEDDANRQLANGFHQGVDLQQQRQMQVLPVAGGWSEVLNDFVSVHVKEMKRWPNRKIVLLIDFDGNENRLTKVREVIPSDLEDRVFVLGVLTKPEDLKSTFGSYEATGSRMANDCRERRDSVWQDALLKHNAPELERLQKEVYQILFKNNESI